MIARRGFLRLLGAAGVAAGLVKYAEPIVEFVQDGAWIEDKGSFLILRIPDGKTFANETFRKPVLVMMGLRSILRDTEFIGVVNIDAGKGGALIQGNIFDASRVLTDRVRPVIEMRGNDFELRDSVVTAGQSNDYAVRISEGSGGVLTNGITSRMRRLAHGYEILSS